MTPEKIAPQLLVMFNNQQSLTHTQFAARYNRLGAVADNTSKPERVIVFVRCELDADLSHLADEGIRVNQTTGSIRTAFLPVEQLGRLSDEPSVQWIEQTQQLRLSMDAAAGSVGLPQFRQTSRLTGRGVVIGIIDSGIDPNHRAFHRRVLRVWDQVIFGPGVPEGGYGVELTGRMKDVSRDQVGHGTHVAGIATGKDTLYGGVAPGAKLVIVKSDLNDAHIADAVRYIFRVAGERDAPAVINMSFGGHFGPHDGSDFLSQVIDEQSGPGRIVCAAAGNEGNDAIHAHISLTSANSRETGFNVPADAAFVVLNGWFSAQDEISVGVRSPEGNETGYQPVGTFDEQTLRDPASGVSDAVQTVVAEQTWSTSDRYFQILIAPDTRSADSTWKLLLRAIRLQRDELMCGCRLPVPTRHSSLSQASWMMWRTP